MKRLILVRHGKSSWKYDVQDKERPLKKRAFKDADKVLNSLKPEFETPATLWSSPATRALETAKLFKKQLEIEDEHFHVRQDLYTFDEDALMEIITSCNDSIDQLMIFAHNPAITEVVNNLGDQYFDNVPTTGLTVIDFEAKSWEDIKSGKTIFYLFPKNL